MPPIPAPRPSRARSASALAGLGLLLVPLVGFSSQVSVAVDGQVVEGRVTSETVGDVLADLGIEVGPDDRVVPDPATPVRQGLQVSIERAVSFTVITNRPSTARITAPASSVQAALELAGHPRTRELGAVVEPVWRTEPRDGTVIRVHYPVPTSITVDGTVLEADTVSRSVAELLDEQGIVLGVADRISPALDTPILSQRVDVVVERVETTEEVVEVVLPFTSRDTRTAELEVGQSRVEQEGASGLRLDTFAVVYVDGIEESRTLLDEELVRPPVERVVAWGTRVTAGSTIWDELAMCESRGNWAIDGPRYDGGLQFHPSTWNSYKPAGYPEFAWQASREQQIEVAVRVQARQGWRAWPACARKLGLL
ncbi:MAG: Resuscitation-promoting factor Rpf2 precursor [Actinomycetota bacterium]|jgi:uncharacterized protein YabE (DUF348 family)